MGLLEAVFTIVVIVALLLLFGVPPETVLSWSATILMGLVLLTMLLFTLFFVITDISLLFRRRVKGKFLRVDDSGRFDNAIYEAEGAEYRCLFPAESFGRKRIYREGEEYMLLIPRNKNRHSAYDRHSLITIVIGTVCSGVFLYLLLIAAQFIRSLFV